MTLLTHQDRVRIRQATILGLARQPLTPPAALEPMLASAKPGVDPVRITVVLAAQRQRFERPPPAAVAETHPSARQMHADIRPIVPPQLRRALVRLSNAVAKGHTSLVLQSAVARITLAGLRPHPFDLPRLMPHIKSNVFCLGLAERAYLALTEKPGDEQRVNVLHVTITAENWTDFPKAHRRDFLAHLRAADSGAARALLEGVFKNEPASVRGELLEALEVRLNTDDLPFLESLANDRADSVKAVASRLTARVPGTPAFQARLAEAAACFQKKSAVKSLMSQIGLAAAGDVTFVAPKPANPGQIPAAQKAAATAALFAAVSLDELASATGFSDAQLLAALVDREDIIDALMATAAACADHAAHARLFDHKVAALAQASDLHAYTLMTLHTLARGPMQPATAERLFASPAWAGLITRLTSTEHPGRDDGALLFITMLMPASAMPRLLTAIEPVHTVGVREARAYADLVLAIPQQL